jgi:hypothetical protein
VFVVAVKKKNLGSDNGNGERIEKRGDQKKNVLSRIFLIHLGDR